jgi:signal peptidase I
MSTARLIAQPILIALALAFAMRSAVSMYSIPSPSMEPVLRVGDHIMVTPYFAGGRPQRGDVIVFHSPLAGEELLVKRVVGIPGDVVGMRGGQQVVPSDCYFVLGDNRTNSFDSRHWGLLPASLIVGHARLVLWSSGDGAAEPRAHASSRWDVGRSDRPLRITRIFEQIR